MNISNHNRTGGSACRGVEPVPVRFQSRQSQTLDRVLLRSFLNGRRRGNIYNLEIRRRNNKYCFFFFWLSFKAQPMTVSENEVIFSQNIYERLLSVWFSGELNAQNVFATCQRLVFFKMSEWCISLWNIFALLHSSFFCKTLSDNRKTPKKTNIFCLF